MIREARASDAKEWLRMRCLLWSDATPEEHAAEIAEYFAVRDSLVTLVAERSDNSLCGFLEASVRDYAEGCQTLGVGYIEGWFIDEDARRQGVGAQLVRAAEAWARSRGCREMASDCLLENDISLAAHLCLGYEEVERAIHFRKTL